MAAQWFRFGDFGAIWKQFRRRNFRVSVGSCEMALPDFARFAGFDKRTRHQNHDDGNGARPTPAFRVFLPPRSCQMRLGRV
jgi:hypothetical protein